MLGGALLTVLAIAALTYATIEAGARGLTDALVLSMLAVAVIAGIAFVVVQRRVSHPMVPPEVFRLRDARIAMAVGFAFMVCYFGLALTPFSALLVERFGARALVVTGLLFMSVGLSALALLAPTASPAWISALMLVVGLGGPLVSPPITAVLLHSAPPALSGISSGVYNTSRQVGAALAVGVFGAFLNQSESFEMGMRISLLTATGVALLAACLSFGLNSPGSDTASSGHA